jgi:hypothetical protein
MIWFRQNRVALTILIGLALIALVAIGQSAVAFFAIARFGASFNEIAETNLSAQIAASQLSQHSQTLVATAPEIALANTQLRRQAIIDQLNERPRRWPASSHAWVRPGPITRKSRTCNAN